jgi:hypothetical protein
LEVAFLAGSTEVAVAPILLTHRSATECLFLDATVHLEQTAMVREELLNASTQ